MRVGIRVDVRVGIRVEVSRDESRDKSDGEWGEIRDVKVGVRCETGDNNRYESGCESGGKNGCKSGSEMMEMGRRRIRWV